MAKIHHQGYKRRKGKEMNNPPLIGFVRGRELLDVHPRLGLAGWIVVSRLELHTHELLVLLVYYLGITCFGNSEVKILMGHSSKAHTSIILKHALESGYIVEVGRTRVRVFNLTKRGIAYAVSKEEEIMNGFKALTL